MTVPPGAAEARIEKLGITELCDRIVAGETITAICRSIGVTKGSLRRWIALDANRAAQVHEARVGAAQAFDEMAEDAIKNARDKDGIAKARELAHHYRWRASKINPREYGDKLEIDQQTTIINLSDEEIARRAAKIRADLEANAQPVHGTASQ